MIQDSYVLVQIDSMVELARHMRLHSVVVVERSHEEDVVGSNPDVDTYSKHLKNKSCELWLFLSPLDYIKNIVSYFY